jgi:predicted amidohydrolase
MSLRIAALQMRTSPDRAVTLARAAGLIALAAKRGADLVCLPEAFTGLYGVDYFAHNAEEFKGSSSGSAMMAGAAAEHRIYVCGGVIERHPISGAMYNTIAAFDPLGLEVARYRKIHLSRVSVGADTTSEGDVLKAGDSLGWFDVPDTSPGADGRGWRVGLANCFDLRFASLHSMLSAAPPDGVGAEVVLYPASWLKTTGVLGHWETLLKARALDGQCYVLGVSNARDETHDPVAYGHSAIIGPMGETLAACGNDEADEVVVASLSLAALVDARRRIPLGAAGRPLVCADALRAQQQDPRAMGRPPAGWSPAQ